VNWSAATVALGADRGGDGDVDLARGPAGDVAVMTLGEVTE